MSDLNTTIGADDAEFHRGMDRVNRRMTSLSVSTERVRSGFTGLRSAMTGLGAAGVASQIVQITKELEEMATRGEKARLAMSEIGIEASKAANAAVRALNGDKSDSRQDVFAKRSESLQKLNDSAMEYESKLRSMSLLDRVKFYQANTEDTGLVPAMNETGSLTGIGRYLTRIYNGLDSVRERAIDEQWNGVLQNNSIVDQGSEREDTARAKKQALDETNRQIAEMKNDSAESAKSWDEWFAAQEKFNHDREEEAARIKELLGDGKAADLMRLQSRMRDKIREIEYSALASTDQGRDLIRFYRSQGELESAAINARYLAEDEMKRRMSVENSAFHSMSGSVGGATLAQQLAALVQPAQQPLKDMKEIQQKILNELISRLPSPGGGLVAQYGW